MAVAHHQHRESSSGSSINKHLNDAGKYVRYTSEQVEALERVYAECPKPSSLRRQQLIRDCPILSNIEPKQIKVWFQNRRYEQTLKILDYWVFLFLNVFAYWRSRSFFFGCLKNWVFSISHFDEVANFDNVFVFSLWGFCHFGVRAWFFPIGVLKENLCG